MKKRILIQSLCDTMLIAGFSAFVYGLSLAWRPLAFIVGGLSVGAAAFFFGYGSKGQ